MSSFKTYLKSPLALGAIAVTIAISAILIGASSGASKENQELAIKTPQLDIQAKASDSFKVVQKAVTRVNLSDRNTIVFFSEFDFEVANAFVTSLNKLNSYNTNDPIYVILNSPGGYVSAGATMISAIEASRRPVYTVCHGLCASMAAMTHSYGAKRFLSDRSILMYHNASGGLQGEVPKMLSRLNLLNRFVNKMELNVAYRANIPLAEYRSLATDELWIDAEDAVARRFADGILAFTVTSSAIDKLLSQKVNSNNMTRKGINTLVW